MLRLTKVSYNFGSNWALKNISFSLHKGDFLFLTGPSGAGKTTLLRLLYGALPLTRGLAQVAGFQLKGLHRRQLPQLRRQIGVVFQDFKILPLRTAFDNVALALEVRGTPQQLVERRVRAVLRALELEDKAHVQCEKLSGGEQQRVAIARSVVINPQLILADEPTGNLDPELSTRLMDVFKQFHTFGTTIIMATHSPDIVHSQPEAKVLHLEHGGIAAASFPLDEVEGVPEEWL
ncbi:cell division ATP-binding protein FtsE [Desulfocurvibacter africanus]|uniref:cell division ATP-binding protein FtsE n=1 Tax=Desulfocurvibacter africanus TaxID=873 RepID=UPI0004248451|nr:cell division ATP-binding protein FtsE [Desulfocurvibacter africanus]